MYSRGIFIKKVGQPYFCVPWVSHMTKHVDDLLGIRSAVFKSQNSKWPPHERKNGIKSSIMVIETHAVDQFYVLSSQKIQF